MKYLTSLTTYWKNFFRGTKGTTVRLMFPVVFSFLALLGAMSISSDRSYVRLEVSETTVLTGEAFTIQVYAYATVPVNAVDVEIEYPADKIEILSVDKGQSVLTIWTEEPVVSQSSITFAGGTFQRGFVGEHIVATIEARAKFTGQTELSVDSVELLAGDGKGTPVAVDTTNQTTKTSFYIYDEDNDPESIRAALGININPDINNDGKVTLADISIFMSAWTATDRGTFDFNSDGKMNFVDFSIILAKSFFTI